MKYAGLIALALMATSGAALAQQVTGPSAPEIAQITTAAGRDVARAENDRAPDFGGVALKMASVADVDLNSDGYVSFEELLRFDVTKDF